MAAVTPVNVPGTVELTQITAPSAEPGYLTTEFWVTIATMLISFLASAGVFDQATVVRLGGLITGAAAIVGYAISRGIRKSGTPS